MSLAIRICVSKHKFVKTTEIKFVFSKHKFVFSKHKFVFRSHMSRTIRICVSKHKFVETTEIKFVFSKSNLHNTNFLFKIQICVSQILLFWGYICVFKISLCLLDFTNLFFKRQISKRQILSNLCFEVRIFFLPNLNCAFSTPEKLATYTQNTNLLIKKQIQIHHEIIQICFL